MPLTVLKQDLKDRIAVCVQRHTANIVIEDDRRARSAGVLLRRRRPGRRSTARRRLRLSAPQRPQRSSVVELEQHAVGRRAASLCAALLTSAPALAPTTSAGADAAMSAPALTPDPVPPAQLPASASPEASFVPGTPGMDVEPPDQADAGAAACERAMSAMYISPVCSVASDVHMCVEEPAGAADAAAVHVHVCEGAAGVVRSAAVCEVAGSLG